MESVQGSNNLLSFLDAGIAQPQSSQSPSTITYRDALNVAGSNPSRTAFQPLLKGRNIGQRYDLSPKSDAQDSSDINEIMSILSLWFGGVGGVGPATASSAMGVNAASMGGTGFGSTMLQ